MRTYIPVELRRYVYQRARGRCEYCLIPEKVAFAPHEIDHIIPQKHGGQTDAENLALSCTLCNKHKGSDLTSIDPLSGAIVPLYHPRRDQWTQHFQLQEAQIVALTPTGRVTVRLLQFNIAERVEERAVLFAAGLFDYEI